MMDAYFNCRCAFAAAAARAFLWGLKVSSYYAFISPVLASCLTSAVSLSSEHFTERGWRNAGEQGR